MLGAKDPAKRLAAIYRGKQVLAAARDQLADELYPSPEHPSSASALNKGEHLFVRGRSPESNRAIVAGSP
jgi:hypothetical protein